MWVCVFQMILWLTASVTWGGPSPYLLETDQSLHTSGEIYNQSESCHTVPCFFNRPTVVKYSNIVVLLYCSTAIVQRHSTAVL